MERDTELEFERKLASIMNSVSDDLYDLESEIDAKIEEIENYIDERERDWANRKDELEEEVEKLREVLKRVQKAGVV